jgi:hypothetical protein
MTRRVLALFAAVVAAGPLVAQTKEIDAQVKKDLNAVRNVERTEDVEVLRRILNRAIGLPHQALPSATAEACAACHAGDLTTHGHAATVLNDFGSRAPARGPGWSPHAVGPFDGVYLPGHGVVYTLKVPASVKVILDPPAKSVGLLDTCLKCHAAVPKDAVEPVASAAAPPSEWDHMRAELAGQKPPAEQPGDKVVSATVCDPGKMTEAILTKLRENAGHVRHLAPTDRVTVVVTFDGYSGSARDRYLLNSVGWTRDLRTGNPFAAVNPGQPIDATSGMMMTGAPAARPGFTTEEWNLLNVADTHLKQNRPKDAAAAYEKALYRFKEAVTKVSPPASLTASQKAEFLAEFQKGVRDAYRRLAQALLAENQADKAQAALELSRKFTIEFGAAPPASVPVPAKLVLGVAKADLDKAAADPAAFKKAVTVETVGFPAADRPKSK